MLIRQHFLLRSEENIVKDLKTTLCQNVLSDILSFLRLAAEALGKYYFSGIISVNILEFSGLVLFFDNEQRARYCLQGNCCCKG